MAGHTSGRIPDEPQRRVSALLSKFQLPDEFLNELIQRSTPVSFARKEMVCLKGSTADMGYWVLSGLVKIYCPMPDSTRVLVTIAGPGDLVGLTDATDRGGRRVQAFEAQAMTRVSVAIFTRDSIFGLLKTLSPERLVAFFQEINTAWSEMLSWYTWFLGLSFHQRLQWVFKHLAQRFGVRDARGIILMPELSHEELAEMIASSRPMVSRLIGECIERGELARRDKRYIVLKSSKREPADESPSQGQVVDGAKERDRASHKARASRKDGTSHNLAASLNISAKHKQARRPRVALKRARIPNPIAGTRTKSLTID